MANERSVWPSDESDQSTIVVGHRERLTTVGLELTWLRGSGPQCLSTAMRLIKDVMRNVSRQLLQG